MCSVGCDTFLGIPMTVHRGIEMGGIDCDTGHDSNHSDCDSHKSH